MAETRAWIGLGSNLDSPLDQVRAALTELAALPDTRLAACSRLYRSAPMGPPGQPDYINAVAGVDTGLPPQALLDALQAIERAHGRVRGEHWGPRTLDLDILLYGDLKLDSPRLHLPHPGLLARNFVLVPLAELAPGLMLDGVSVAGRAARLGRAGLEVAAPAPGVAA
ncbi:MAG TPA: 2-amino-4-hydroxy-6-hydroxymethyldihydropteridine diphosphokinase [Gammaproteobacteria bacterium]|nr:2-amino-4-hydroxy-6-hydroxymethyldihydropteridine diphosphokinase [Gammaproteobacteria bacterium]